MPFEALLRIGQLSDLLDYENAQIAHLNERALNGLVAETKEENSKMRVLSVSHENQWSDISHAA